MKQLKKLGIISTLALGLTGIAHADSTCSGFQIKLKNTLPDDFIISNVEVNNAELQPEYPETLKSNAEQILTITNASKDKPMQGELSLHTISLPIKKVKVKFKLEDKSLYCGHVTTQAHGDYAVKDARVPGGVNYTITG